MNSTASPVHTDTLTEQDLQAYRNSGDSPLQVFAP